MTLYVPNYDSTIIPCVVVLNENTIRAYNELPLLNTTVSYTDYYFNSSYIAKQGFEDITPLTELIICVPNHTITNDVYYRNDIDGIMVTFVIYVSIAFILPLIIIKRLFRRR